MTKPTTPAVYTCINAVQAKLAELGISKSRSNAQQGYKFRGIDDVYNALAPLLAANNLVILPRVLHREVIERESSQKKAIFYVVLDVEFDFVCSTDGSQHTVRVMGEAMDSADKATNKAMSAAYKYACIQAFCIPTEGDNDADATTHEVAAAEPAFDWATWLKNTGAAVRACESVAELDELCKVNAKQTSELAKINAKHHERLLAIISEKREQLTGEQQ